MKVIFVFFSADQHMLKYDNQKIVRFYFFDAFIFFNKPTWGTRTIELGSDSEILTGAHSNLKYEINNRHTHLI